MLVLTKIGNKNPQPSGVSRNKEARLHFHERKENKEIHGSHHPVTRNLTQEKKDRDLRPMGIRSSHAKEASAKRT